MVDDQESKSKGYTIKGALAFVDNRYGPEGRNRVIEAMGESGEVLRGTLIPSSWYPFSLQVGLYEAIDRIFGKGDFLLCREIGRFTAEFELSTIHKMVMKVGGPERLLKLSSMMWGRYYSQGKLQLESIGKGRGVAIVTDFNPISKAFCNDLTGWMERTLELTSARVHSMVHTSCILDGDPACRYEGAWE